MTLIHTVLAFIFAIGVMVLVHELGHYWVARLCNVKVQRFALGFGPLIASKKLGADQTEWCLCLIPLGGYVAMLDEDPFNPGEVLPQELHRAYSQQTVGKRAAIAVAGPLANLLLAMLLYFCLAMAGIQQPKTFIDDALENSPAAAAGLVRGDEIIKVEEVATQGWLELRAALLPAVIDQRVVSLEVHGANGSNRLVNLDLTKLPELEPEQDPLSTVGLQLLMPQPRIGKVEAGGAAQLAGLQEGDVLKTVNQQPIQSSAQFVRLVQASVDQPLNIGIERTGRALEITAMPQKIRVSNDQWQARLGVGLHAPIEKILVRKNLGEALLYGWTQTVNNFVLSFRLLWKMLTAQLSLNHLSGPITVADYAGKTAQIGWQQYLGFIAVISIGIAVFNLLPIPMLDGGHLMYHALEFIRRKPLSMQTMQLLRRGGISLLALVMSVAVFNDLSRLLT